MLFLLIRRINESINLCNFSWTFLLNFSSLLLLSKDSFCSTYSTTISLTRDFGTERSSSSLAGSAVGSVRCGSWGGDALPTFDEASVLGPARLASSWTSFFHLATRSDASLLMPGNLCCAYFVIFLPMRVTFRMLANC